MDRRRVVKIKFTELMFILGRSSFYCKQEHEDLFIYVFNITKRLIKTTSHEKGISIRGVFLFHYQNQYD
ncbi:hypothetical protein PIROE2DRAFT_10883 [Piromyces sp. E2]|nr:hypothetical protein PIROE2DRAFT_10883 [Piromyces sp. E2]|eukprot:OUM62730.1 hypothetical protein PIROE2DRAFT_10883 [Piromyces sp. E2]